MSLQNLSIRILVALVIKEEIHSQKGKKHIKEEGAYERDF